MIHAQNTPLGFQRKYGALEMYVATILAANLLTKTMYDATKPQLLKKNTKFTNNEKGLPISTAKAI